MNFLNQINIFNKPVLPPPSYSDYSYMDPRRYSMIIKNIHETCLHSFTTLQSSKILNSSFTLLGEHKEIITGGLIISGVVFFATRYFRDLPKKPLVNMTTTLNYAKLSIKLPEAKTLYIPEVRLIFCIDTSGSMKKETKEESVKMGVNQVLEDALNIVNTIPGSKIGTKIIGFDTTFRTIVEYVGVGSETIANVREKMNQYESKGETEILQALNGSISAIEELQGKNKKMMDVLVLLTDGDNVISRQKKEIDQKDIDAFHERLFATKARFFAVGIGNKHDKKTLGKLAPTSDKFTAEYIDVASKNDSIINAIQKIYQKMVSNGYTLRLTSLQLEPETWSVNDHYSLKEGDKSVADLGLLPEGVEKEVVIKIDGMKLKTDLDLSKVSFDLDFTDSFGKKGTISLPWEPHSKIIPRILNFNPNGN